jgi:hypothetical protein
MAKKKGTIPSLEDMSAATIAYPCVNEACTHKYEYTGKQYEKNPELSGPKCGWHTTVDQSKLVAIFSEKVRRAKAAHEAFTKNSG